MTPGVIPNTNIVDLTLPMSSALTPSPGEPSLELLPVNDYDSHGYRTSQVTMGTHYGTHMDAPCHFVRGAPGIESIRLSRTIGPAQKIDLGILAPNSQITCDMLEPYESSISSLKRVVIATGWDERIRSPEYYTEQPSLTYESVSWLVLKGVSLIGVDMPSLSSSEPESAHRAAAESEVIILESLVNLRHLRANPFLLIALPLPITGADGCPTRVIAVEFNHRATS